MHTGTARDFDGPHSATELPGLSCFRVDSMDVTNDPRMFAKNVIMKRLAAFHLIAVCAILMGCSSSKLMFAMLDPKFEDRLQYVCVLILGCCAVSNFLCVIIIVQQLFHVSRLVTAGPAGYEISKSYYLNPNVVTLRHCGVRLFFWAIPLYIACMAYSVFVKLGVALDEEIEPMSLYHALPAGIIMILMSIGLYLVIRKHRMTFHERYTLAKEHEKPLMGHIHGLEEVAYRGTEI